MARSAFLIIAFLIPPAATALLFGLYPPGVTVEAVGALGGPFIHESGFEYSTTVPAGLISDAKARGSSPIRLYENDRELGPAHSFHDDIQRKGAGSFFHDDGRVYFSTMDNTDPAVNGRKLEIRFPRPLPAALYIGMLLIMSLYWLFAAWLVHRALRENHPVCAGSAMAALTGILVLGFAEAASWTLVQNALVVRGPLVRRFYEYGLGAAGQGYVPTQFPGLSLNYMEHHYLNYALNPDTAYCGEKQFDARYRIRRSEAIRPRTAVKWRVVVLGGSTTFGEGIPRERDTWPAKLEERIRAAYGPDCDVINCGVGGYTSAENLIHYLFLLAPLEPDVALLYTGINDVHARLFGEIATDYANYRKPWRDEAGPFPLASTSLSKFYVYRYYYLHAKALRFMDEGIGGKVSRKGPPPREWEEALRRNSPEVYRMHLEQLVDSLTVRSIRVAILPQYFTPRLARDEVFGRGVESHNEVNRATAAKYTLPFASDFNAPGAFGPGDTFDSCHFNEAGAEKAAEYVFKFMETADLLPRNEGSVHP